MERGRALAVAGSLTITALAGVLFAGASTGLFGFGSAGVASPTGSSVPNATPSVPQVVEVTVPAPANPSVSRAGTSVGPIPTAAVAEGPTSPRPDTDDAEEFEGDREDQDHDDEHYDHERENDDHDDDD